MQRARLSHPGGARGRIQVMQGGWMPAAGSADAAERPLAQMTGDRRSNSATKEMTCG